MAYKQAETSRKHIKMCKTLPSVYLASPIFVVISFQYKRPQILFGFFSVAEKCSEICGMKYVVQKYVVWFENCRCKICLT